MVVESIKDPEAPLVSLAWQNVKVTAVVVGVSNGHEGTIFPVLDERLPHRRGVRSALQVNPRVAAAATAAATSPSPTSHLQKGPYGLAPSSRVISKNRHGVVRNVHHQGLASRGVAGGDGPAAAGGSSSPAKRSGNLRCPICSKDFTKSTYLKRHVASHSGIKPYKCDICGWGFFQHCNLKRHMTSHAVSGGQGFKCLHCPASFSTKSVLSVHMRDAHGDGKQGAAAGSNGAAKNSTNGVEKK